MSHELTFNSPTNLVEMAYSAEGGEPWHGLGQSKPQNVRWSIDDWQRNAGMLWTIESAVAQFAVGPDQTPHSFPGQNILFRSDTHAPLAVVSDRYQNVKIFAPRPCFDITTWWVPKPLQEYRN